MAYCKVYYKIAATTFTLSILGEYYMYNKSNKKNYKNEPVQLQMLHFNILNKSLWRGILWPIHLPQIGYHMYNKSLPPIYLRSGYLYTSNYFNLDYDYYKMKE